MTPRDPSPASDQLEKIFHEPNRLTIMSAVCGAPAGISFPELREACGLTDGNLNRHLKVLQEADAVQIEKAFVDAKPRTTITLTAVGLKRFNEYLEALSGVLRAAQAALPQTDETSSPFPVGRTVRA